MFGCEHQRYGRKRAVGPAFHSTLSHPEASSINAYIGSLDRLVRLFPSVIRRDSGNTLLETQLDPSNEGIQCAQFYFAFAALNFAQRALVALEIAALATLRSAGNRCWS
jgi:hypothetical protein